MNSQSTFERKDVTRLDNAAQVDYAQRNVINDSNMFGVRAFH